MSLVHDLLRGKIHKFRNLGSGASVLTGLYYVHNQSSASNSWTINHNMGAFPNVTTVDSAGTKIEGDVQYIDANVLVVNFGNPFSGNAYLT